MFKENNMNLQEAIEFLDQQGYYLTENNSDKSAGDWYNEYNKLGGRVYDIEDLFAEIFGYFPENDNSDWMDEVTYDEVVEKLGTSEEVVAKESKQRKIKIDNLLSYVNKILPEVEDILQEKIDISNGKYDTHIEFNQEFKNNKVVKLNGINWEHAAAWICDNDNITFAVKNDDLYGIICDGIMFRTVDDLDEYING